MAPPATSVRPIRFPLQTGESALLTAWVASVVVLFGGLCASLAVPRGGLEGLTSSTLLGTIAIFVVGAGLLRLRRAYQERASDAWLSHEGVSLQGGPHHGRALSWSEIDPARCELLADDEALRSSRGLAAKDRVYKLLLALKDGDVLCLAETREYDERRSLDALLAALRSARWYGKVESAVARVSAGRWRSMGLEVLACPTCGAPCAPGADVLTRCGFCGHDFRAPDEVHARLAAAAQYGDAHARVERVVVRLLDQPGARITTALLVSAAVAGLLGIPAVLLAPSAGAFLLAGAVAATLYLWAHGTAIDRRALRLLSVGAGAQTPCQPGEPYLCRVCDAPLSIPAADRIVVTCSYCSAPNVLGLDLRIDASREQAEAGALQALLEDRTKRLRGRAVGLAVTGMAMVASVALLLR